MLRHGDAASVMELAPVLRSSAAVDSSALASTPQESRKTRAVQTQQGHEGRCFTAPGRMATVVPVTVSTAALSESLLKPEAHTRQASGNLRRMSASAGALVNEPQLERCASPCSDAAAGPDDPGPA